MQLEVVGPERDHGGDGGARAHEREVRARQLEQQDRRSRRVGPAWLARRSSRSAVGQRFPARAPRLTASVDPGRAEDRGDERGRRRLAGGAGDADARPGPALEQEVAEARDAGSLGAQALDAGRHFGRPDVEVGDLGRAGVGVEVGARLQLDPELAELRSPRAGRRARRRGRRGAPGGPPGEQAGERKRIGVEPLDEDRHVAIIAVSVAVSRT